VVAVEIAREGDTAIEPVGLVIIVVTVELIVAVQ
jgi:hypothetical protein